MNNRKTILFALMLSAGVALSGIYFAGCTQTTSTASGVPSNVSVMQAGPTTAMVMWTRSSDDNGTDTVIAAVGAATSVSLAPSPTSQAYVGPLQMGVTYSITVHSSGGSSSAVTFMLSGPPTGLKALAVSSTVIGLKWSGSTMSDSVFNGTSFLGMATGSSQVTNLSPNTAYTFSIHNAAGVSNSITWMTAQRTTGLKIYEVDDPSSSHPSGLILGGSGMTSATAVPLSQGATADFILESYPTSTVPSGISLVASNVHNASWLDTKVNGTILWVPGGLNSNYRGTDYMNEMGLATYTAYDLPTDAVYATKGSAIMIVKTSDAHLALVEIVPDPSTGMLYSTSGGYKYITVNVSYQSNVNTGYASRPHLARPSGPVARVSAH